MNAGAILYTASVWAIPIVVAITLHEVAHGWVAGRLGDDTARRLGRVSFNPLRHIDPLGTVLLPALLLVLGAPFLFGYAKPVPVNFARLAHPRRDTALVAFAGPGANLLLAVAAALLVNLALRLPDSLGSWFFDNLVNAIRINIWLFAFNLIPVPPLDGGRVVLGLLPADFARFVAARERLIIFALLGVIFVLPPLLARFAIDFDPIRWILGPVVRGLFAVIENLFLFGGAAG